MYLIEVIPLSRGIGKETLSYFSSNHISPGSLVVVPVRKRSHNALVVSSRDARDAKSEIRSSDYAMKKVTEFKAEEFLSEEFMNAARKTAEFFAGSLGSVLNTLLPKAILESAGSFQIKKKSLTLPPASGFDRLAFQAADTERLAMYRSLIREEFARKCSVFLCLPTAALAKRFIGLLSKGIEQYTYGLYGSLPKKKTRAVWENALAEEHPVLIIATGLFFSLCRSDIGTIVIENESSRSYKLLARPYLDVRTFAEFFAKESKVKFLAADTLLRIETIYRCKLSEFAEASPLIFRSLSPATSSIVDMTPYKKSEKHPGAKFETVSAELATLIQNSYAANQNLFIFGTRRGLSPQTVCGDCGAVVTCTRCHSPIPLHRARVGLGSENFFFCHSCGEKRGTEERCVSCTSWKLQPLGIGIELVETEIKRKFPHIELFRIDKDVTPTEKSASLVANNFYASPGSILLGTEMALPHLDKKIGNTAVASLDSLFSLPDFRIHEKILHLLLKIRSLTESKLIIQTRVPKELVLEYALKGNLIDFYREEIAARQTFNYPPFKTLIKVSLAGIRANVIREMEKLKSYFAPFETELFPAFIEESRGLFTMHALVRLLRDAWIDRDLLKKLLSLPPQFRVAVDPESLL